MGQYSRKCVGQPLAWAAALLSLGCVEPVISSEVPLINLGSLESALTAPDGTHSVVAHSQRGRHRGSRRRHQLARHWRHQGLPIAPESTQGKKFPSHDCPDLPLDAALEEADWSDAGAPVEEPLVDAALPLPVDTLEDAPNREIVAESRLDFRGWANGEELTQRQVWKRLKRNRAVCLGELHDNPYHHNFQHRTLRKLARKAQRHHRKLAVGYEMFQRPYQLPLEDFVAGSIDEADFLEQTEYAERWGWDFSLYRPLLEATSQFGLPALALNARRELTRQIGREGLENLSPELTALLPELDLDDQEHREYIFGLFGLTPEHPAAASLENIYTAQTTWDETMADTASNWISDGHRRRLLLFAGMAHCHRSAIPRRLERRTGKPVLSVAPVMQSEWLLDPDGWQGYDLLIILDDSEIVSTISTDEEESQEPVNPHAPAEGE